MKRIHIYNVPFFHSRQSEEGGTNQRNRPTEIQILVVRQLSHQGTSYCTALTGIRARQTQNKLHSQRSCQAGK